MTATSEAHEHLLRSLAQDRVHSAYLLSGRGDAPRELALWLARLLVCQAPAAQGPCESCTACRRSAPGDPIPLDGSGKKGPLLRHVGDHADLLWVERGESDTRVRIGQVRAMQAAFRLRSSEGGRRAAVLADAEWLNQEAQNALLRLLEEPPAQTTLILVTQSPAGLLATVRSRCQRVVIPATQQREPSGAEQADQIARLETLAGTSTPELLDWAEEFRGPRAIAAAALGEFLSTASAWVHGRACESVEAGGVDVQAELDAFATVAACRKSLVQRNANPQMVAEKALLALRDASRGAAR